MTRPAYTRFTLRLLPGVEPPGPAYAAAGVAGSRQALSAEALLEAGVQPDDWSGAAAHARGVDPEALDYLHPEAVALVRELQPGGWQTDDARHVLTFWLEEGDEESPEVAGRLARLRAFGDLHAAPEAPGWEFAWRRFHKPHAVGRLYLRPPWYPARDDLLDVIVDAGLAFGTGGHATTRQCIEEIQDIEPGPLLDLGSGSGVVAFAALRLGFSPVWGVEIDPLAVRASRENARRNGLAPELLVGDATDPAFRLPAAGTIVANIALAPILRLARRFDRREAGEGVLRPGNLVLAGLLVEQADRAAAAFPDYEIVGRRDDGMWITLRLRRRA